MGRRGRRSPRGGGAFDRIDGGPGHDAILGGGGDNILDAQNDDGDRVIEFGAGKTASSGPQAGYARGETAKRFVLTKRRERRMMELLLVVQSDIATVSSPGLSPASSLDHMTSQTGTQATC